MQLCTASIAKFMCVCGRECKHVCMFVCMCVWLEPQCITVQIAVQLSRMSDVPQPDLKSRMAT